MLCFLCMAEQTDVWTAGGNPSPHTSKVQPVPRIPYVRICGYPDGRARLTERTVAEKPESR